MSSQGYFINAVNNSENTDNVLAAYLLACTIKMHDKTREICVMVNDGVTLPAEYSNAIDYTVVLPFGLHYPEDMIVDYDLWQMYHVTPFDETLYIDRYSLLLNDVEELWRYAANYDILFPQNTINFRHELNLKHKIFDNHYANRISDVWHHVFYFKKSAIAAEFFEFMDLISKHKTAFSKTLMTDRLIDFIDISLVTNMALTALALDKNVYSSSAIRYTFNALDGLPHYEENYPPKWHQYLPSWFYNGCELKVGNFTQTGIFVYGDYAYLTAEIAQSIADRFKIEAVKS
jgi:hypothetical protein